MSATTFTSPNKRPATNQELGEEAEHGYAEITRPVQIPRVASAFGQVHMPPFLAESQTHEWKGDLIYQARRSIGSYDAEWLWLMFFWLLAVLVAIWAFIMGAPAGVLVLLLPGCLWLNLVLKSCATRYYIYQNRIDFHTGLLSKHIHSVWFWQIKDIEYHCSFLDRLTGGSEIRILAAKATHEQVEGIAEYRIIGLPSARPGWGANKFMQELYHELFDAVVQKRRTMKNWFM